jgi:hypothetical protein
LSATTVSGSWGDWVSKALLTINGIMREDDSTVILYDAFYKVSGSYGNFSDTTNNSTNHPYNQITFESLADNYYTQVIVEPESVPKVVVSTGSKPFRTYEVNTFTGTAGQAQDYADYLLSTYGTKAIRVSSITCPLNSQIGALPVYGQSWIGAQVSVLFRGTTYQCKIEGATWSGTPSESQVTFYFSANDLNNFLLLDNTVYGTLDYNRLGY